MPYGTIELPRVMIDAASTFAKREKMSVSALFADLLRQRYGFTMAVAVAKETPRKRRVPVPDEVRAVTGIISLPPDVSDSDLVREAVLDKTHRFCVHRWRD